MTTGTLTFNEKSDFGKRLLQLIQTDAETTFEVRKNPVMPHEAADETLQAIEDVKAGKGRRYKDFDEFKERMYAL